MTYIRWRISEDFDFADFGFEVILKKKSLGFSKNELFCEFYLKIPSPALKN